MAGHHRREGPAKAVWAQTVIASLFALVAFIVMLSIGVGGGQPIEIQTKVYDVLQAAVAVIATLSGSWTPLISNDSGIGVDWRCHRRLRWWFCLVAGIAASSLLVAVGIYFLGNATSARAAGTTQQAKRATT